MSSPPPGSHPDPPFDAALAYHAHVAAGTITSYDHLVAGALAAAVAHAEYTSAALATTPAARRMFLRAADRARLTRDRHHLAANITAVGQPVTHR